MWKNNMQTIANIGTLTRPQFRNMPTLDLAGAVDSYYDAKNAATQRELARQQREKMNAFADELTAQHPEAAARIAVDPAAYANYLDEQAKAERDQQYKMDYLNKQFNNSLALADRQNANSIGLARIKQQLANQAASEEKAARSAQLDEALNSGRITPEEYNLIKRRELLGNIVNGGGVAPDGVALTGNKAFDDAYMKETGKKTAQIKQAEADAKSMEPALLQAMDRAAKAAKNGTGVGFIGGTAANWGLNPLPNAGANYADIQSANTQMNTYLRKQLAATGLTGSELNSAVEAQAYRYQINPTDSESVIRRKLQNFVADKLPKKEAPKIYGTSQPIKNGGGLQKGQKIGGFTVIGVE
jgi:hypothetical protein